MSAAMIKITMIQMAMPMLDSGTRISQPRGAVGAALALRHFSYTSAGHNA